MIGSRSAPEGPSVEPLQELAKDRPMALLHLAHDLAHPRLDHRLRGEVEIDPLQALVAIERPPDAVGEPVDELTGACSARRRRRAPRSVIASETRRATAATSPCLEPKW